jgi:copper(I)-binding protein
LKRLSRKVPLAVKLAPLVVLALLAVTACKQEAAPPAPTSIEAKPGITLSEGRLTLPAVKGNPGAVYFTIANANASGNTAIAAVSVKGATKAEMHQTQDGAMNTVDVLEVEGGGTVKFAPGGLHVMAFGLDNSLAVGSTTELTVTFADGDKASLPLKIEPAGGADHGSSH